MALASVMSRVSVHSLKSRCLSDIVSFLSTTVLCHRPFQTTSLLKQADHRQETFHYLIEQTRKLVKPPIGTVRMIGVVLPHASPKYACASHVPSAGKEETGDVLASQCVYSDNCKK